MIEKMSMELLKRASWGLVWRVGIGASISIADVASDIFMLISYYEAGAFFYFKYNLLFLLLTLFAHCIIVSVNRNMIFDQETFFEILLALLCLKPTADAYKVATGHTRNSKGGELLWELSAIKVAETVLESIPCACLQMHALLLGAEDVQLAVLLSIASSAISAGYSTTLMCYDYDTHPEKRKVIVSESRRKSSIIVSRSGNF